MYGTSPETLRITLLLILNRRKKKPTPTPVIPNAPLSSRMGDRPMKNPRAPDTKLNR